MRELGFVPLKSRNLMPGGKRGTMIRGWARPLRNSGKRKNGGAVQAVHSHTSNNTYPEPNRRG
jgi:hypothetical protein